MSQNDHKRTSEGPTPRPDRASIHVTYTTLRSLPTQNEMSDQVRPRQSASRAQGRSEIPAERNGPHFGPSSRQGHYVWAGATPVQATKARCATACACSSDIPRGRVHLRKRGMKAATASAWQGCIMGARPASRAALRATCKRPVRSRPPRAPAPQRSTPDRRWPESHRDRHHDGRPLRAMPESGVPWPPAKPASEWCAISRGDQRPHQGRAKRGRHRRANNAQRVDRN